MDRFASYKLFIEVAEGGSFVAAARRLGISSSAASKGIDRLERRMGVQLLRRSTRTLSLTQAGETFADQCRAIIAAVEFAEANTATDQGKPQGRLRASLPLVTGLVLPAISSFARRYPDVELDLDFSNRLVSVIEEGFDVVVRSGALPDSRLMQRKLGSCHHLLVASPGYLARKGEPLAISDLCDHDLLLHRLPATGIVEKWPLIDRSAFNALHPLRGFTTNNLETLVYMALAGHGIACLPDFAVASCVASSRLSVVLTDTIEAETAFWAVWPASRNPAAKLQAFVDHLAATLFPREGRNDASIGLPGC